MEFLFSYVLVLGIELVTLDWIGLVPPMNETVEEQRFGFSNVGCDCEGEETAFGLWNMGCVTMVPILLGVIDDPQVKSISENVGGGVLW